MVNTALDTVCLAFETVLMMNAASSCSQTGAQLTFTVEWSLFGADVLVLPLQDLLTFTTKAETDRLAASSKQVQPTASLSLQG